MSRPSRWTPVGASAPFTRTVVRASLLAMTILLASACSEDLVPPTARIAGPDTGTVGELIELSGAGSASGQGNSLAYQWSFLEVPAGSQVTLNDPTLVNPSFVPDVAGRYEVALVVREVDLVSAPARLAIDVGICGAQSPVVASVSAEPPAPDTGDVVRLSAEVSDADAGPECGLDQTLAHAWSLTDKPTGSRAALDDSSVPSPTLLADLPGTYAIELQLTDSAGLRSPVFSFTFDVGSCGANAPVVEDITADPGAPVTGAVVALSARYSDPDNQGDCDQRQTLVPRWRLTDRPSGSVAVIVGAELAAPYFVPDLDGAYTVELVVTDSTGRASRARQLGVEVVGCGINRPTVEAITAEPAAPNTGARVQLGADVSDLDTAEVCGDPGVYAYSWSLLAVPPDSVAEIERADTSDPIVRPDVAGDYVVRLAVTDPRGLISAPASRTITASACGAASPEVVLAGSLDDPVVGDTVVINAEVRDADAWDGTDTDPCRLEERFVYDWAFRSLPAESTAGLVAAGTPNASFVPDVPGTYVVEIRVIDAAGHVTVQAITIAVDDDARPEVTAGADPTGGLTPLTVAFSCSSTAGEAPFRYFWDLGNGVTTTEPNPIYTYTQGGTFVAHCHVTDRNGDTGSASVPVAAELDTEPRVSLSAVPVVGFRPLEIDFSSEVDGGNGTLDYTWDWGDGTAGQAGQAPGEIETPSHTFAAAGVHRVTLTVEDGDGDVGVDTRQVAVAVDSRPAVAVRAEPATGISPTRVRLFADVAGGDGPLAYAWDLGDGDFSAARNPVHTYVYDEGNGTGDFRAQVTVIDADGDVATGFVDIAIEPDTSPDGFVSAGTDRSDGLTPLLVQLTCEATAGNQPVRYHWDFGDGQTSALQNPSHVYGAGGDYQAVCAATDANGDEGSGSVSIAVTQDTTPAVEITAQPPAGLAPLNVELTGHVTGGNGTLAYSWDFGDGTSDESGDAGTGIETRTHPFAEAGAYRVTLSVGDEQGDIGVGTVQVAVGTDSQPGIAVSATPREGVSPLDAQLFADVAGGDAPLTFTWDFGDGATSSVQNPLHRFAIENDTADGRPDGVFTARVRVRDADEDFDEASMQIAVEANSEPVAGIDLVEPDTSAEPGLAPLTVRFSCSSDAGNAPLSFLWEFGDGGTAAAPRASHSYAAAGAYTARCTVTDRDGQTSEATTVVHVATDLAPYVSIAADPAGGVDPLDVTFASSVSGGNGNPDAFVYTWHFGDGATAGPATPSADPGIVSPVNTYDLPGAYVARLTVEDEDGDVATASVSVIVRPDTAPTVVASAGATSGVLQLAVDLRADAVGGEAPLTYEWSFGDGGTALGQTAHHLYRNEGSEPAAFDAIVTVRDADGDPASDTVQIIVEPNGTPSAWVGVAPETATDKRGLTPFTAQLSCQSAVEDGTGTGVLIEVGDPPFSFEWAFGDGATSTAANPTHTYTVGGDFLATCLVTDGTGDTSSASVPVYTAQDTAPQVRINADPLTGLEDLEVAFSSSVANGNGPLTYTWDFGDGSGRGPATGGSTASGEPVESPSHTYTRGGRFLARLTVTDADGDVGSDSVVIDVEVDLPAGVSASGDPLAGEPPLEVFFASSPSGNPPFAFAWDFDYDGVTFDLDSNAQNPSHIYGSDGTGGTFTARVLVTDANGDPAEDRVVVRADRRPVASAGADQSVYFGTWVALDGSGSEDLDGDDLVYNWSFVARPPGSTAALNDPGVVNPSFLPDEEGLYRLRLTVADGLLADSDEVVVEMSRTLPASHVLRWQVAAGSWIAQFGDGDIYLSGRIIDPESGAETAFPSGSYIPSIWPDAPGDEILMAAWSNMPAYYKSDGSLAWVADTGGCCNYGAAHTTIDREVGVGHFGSFRSFDLSDGSTIGTLGMQGGWTVLDGEHITSYGNYGWVERKHLPSDTLEWSCQISDSRQLSHAAIAADGSLVTSTGGNRHYGDWQLWPSDGGELVVVPPAGCDAPARAAANAVTTPVVGASGLIYVGSQVPPVDYGRADGAVAAYDMSANLIWSTEIGAHPYDLFVGDDDRVYVISAAGDLLALDAFTGAVDFDVTGLLPAGYMILSDGVVYTTAGQALALPEATATHYQARAPWPVRRHDNQRTGASGLCSDGIQNRDETDVDCGGSFCRGCAPGLHCDTWADCRDDDLLCTPDVSCDDGRCFIEERPQCLDLDAADITRWDVGSGAWIAQFGDGDIYLSGRIIDPDTGAETTFPSSHFIPSIWPDAVGDEILMAAWSNMPAYYKSDGTLAWTADTGGCCNYGAAHTTIDRTAGLGYFGSFRVFDLTDGSTVTDISMPGGWSVLDGDFIYSYGNDGWVARKYLPTNTLEWQCDISDSPQLSHAAIAADGSLVTSTGGNRHYGDWQLWPSDGGELVVVPTGSCDAPARATASSVTSPVIGAGDLIYVGVQDPPVDYERLDGGVAAYDLGANLLWRTELGAHPYDLFVGDDDRVYVITAGGQLYGLAADTGEMELAVNHVEPAGYMILSGGVVYTTAGQALELGDGYAVDYQADAPWPVRRHDNYRTGAAGQD